MKNNQLKGSRFQLPGAKTPRQTRRGFTLIETLVAISILLVSLAGPFSIAAQSLRNAYYARDQVTAFYLAQEGIEYVRAFRDQNYLASQSWLTGVDNCIDVACTVDFTNFSHAVCPSGVCSKLLISSSGGLFNHQSGSPSLFTRTLTITRVPNTNDEIVIKVTVSWTSASLNRSFQLTEHLFNWL